MALHPPNPLYHGQEKGGEGSSWKRAGNQSQESVACLIVSVKMESTSISMRNIPYFNKTKVQSNTPRIQTVTTSDTWMLDMSFKGTAGKIQE